MIAVGILIALVLLALNAFFVGAEFASVSVRRAQIEALADESKRARHVLDAQKRLSMLLAGAQFGITLSSLGIGAVAEPSVAKLVENGLHVVHLPSALAHPVAFAIALLIVVLLHMVLGEMVPKNIALSKPEASALALVPALDRFVGASRPVIRLLNGIANGSLRLLGITPRDELKTAYSPDELADILAESRHEGLLADDEHQRLARTLALHSRTAADVAIAPDQLVTIDSGASTQDVQRLAVTTQVSRFPVVDAGRLIGYVHVQDSIGVEGGLTALVRPLPRLAPHTPLADALVAMQRSNSHLARVGDGVLALSDVVAEVLGRA